MEAPAKACAFFIRSKSRSCKFPRHGDSEFCSLHRGIQGEACDDLDRNTDDQIVPCFIDSRHFVSARKIRSHVRKCSKVRDIAYELRQPFCMHMSGPPHQQLGIKMRLEETGGLGVIGPQEKTENSSLDSKKRPEISEERLEFVEWLHSICVHEFGRNPHLEPDPVYLSDPSLNKHELQALSISKELHKRLIDGSSAKDSSSIGRSITVDCEDSLVVEFGAGNAILSYWFIKECGKPADSRGDSKYRCVVIDRESRRKQMEKSDDSISSIRLRLDIEQFDIGSLISICNDIGISKESALEQMYSGLGDGGMPWIIRTLLEQGIWLYEKSGKRIQTVEEAQQLGKDDLKFILANLSNGGGPDISSLEQRVIEQFAGKPIRKIFVISKHLCGNGFDLGLRSSQSAAKELSCGSMLVVIMSPCCHHRCLFSQHLGVEMLGEYFRHGGLFESPDACFQFLTSVSSWSTGTSDHRSELGFKAKYILDSLRNQGFTHVEYSTFTSKSVSPENILITGIYLKN
ncbi:hypothetical protein OIY81_1370 [Cryptosporidium canis]|nr:hypothetical protein OIY81_1370 [Cryptosporidium canis]